MLSKKELIKNLVKKNESILKCPLCDNELFINNNSLACCKNHVFDIAKNGVIILHKKYRKCCDDIYSKELFDHRRNFINDGFYDEIHDYIKNILKKYFHENPISILDIGSGECTHLNKINQKINQNLIAIDLSYDAIKLGTEYLVDGILPICADLYNLPIKNESIDCVLDFLSPFNKKEIYRVLKNDGIIIKIMPSKNYLIELRELLGYNAYEKEQEVYENLIKNFKILEEKHIKYIKQLNSKNVEDLFKMTPLSNHKIFDLSDLKNLNQITIDLKVIILKKFTKFN